MRFLDVKSIGALGLSLMLGMTAIGCGDDDSTTADGGPDGGKNDGGGAGNGSADSGTDSGKTGGSGGSTVVGGTGGMGGLMGAMCDSTIPTTATCGGMACPTSTSMFAGAVCSVPCCLPDDTCGFRRAVMGSVIDCAPPATADPNCPDMAMGGLGGMMMTDAGATDAGPSDAGDAGPAAGGYQGCCAPSGHCGIISPTDMLCITSSPLIMSLMPGAACGEGNDGGADGG